MHHSPICETFQSSQLHKCLLLHKLNIVCNYIHDVSHIYPSHHIYQAFHLHIHSTGENPNYEYERQIPVIGAATIPATTESAKIDFLKFISSSLSLKIHSSLLHCHFNIIIGKMQ